MWYNNIMETNAIAKNLLEDKNCYTCNQYQDNYNEDEKIIPKMCLYWGGTTNGFRWKALPEENTCEGWNKREE